MTTNSSPPNAEHGLLGASVAHEEANHSLQHLVALVVAASVVIDLEMIDVDEDAAALEIGIGVQSAPRARRGTGG